MVYFAYLENNNKTNSIGLFKTYQEAKENIIKYMINNKLLNNMDEYNLDNLLKNHNMTYFIKSLYLN